MNFFTVDVIGDLAFGKSFDCLQNSEYHPWVKNLYYFLQGMIWAAAARFYPSVEYIFMKMLPKSVMEIQRAHTDFANERIRQRLALDTDRPDFLTPFMKENKGAETDHVCWRNRIYIRHPHCGRL